MCKADEALSIREMAAVMHTMFFVLRYSEIMHGSPEEELEALDKIVLCFKNIKDGVVDNDTSEGLSGFVSYMKSINE
jgi:hypothetical protein